MKRNYCPATYIIAGFILAIAGCQLESPAPPKGPRLAPVTGVVTLNGKPLERANVKFESFESAVSTGLTDADGRYELRYVGNEIGAPIGGHIVRIEMEYRPYFDKERPKPLPVRYNEESQVKVRVKDGQNEYNFDLQSP